MKRHIDYYLFAYALILLACGLLFLATLSAPASMNAFGNPNHYILRQLRSLAIGLILFFITLKTPLHLIKKLSPFLFISNILLLIVVFFPVVGTKFWGASRWISIGGITFQPSEILKITAIIYLSAIISKGFTYSTPKSWIFSAKKTYHDIVKLFLPFLMVLSIIAAILLFQKDLSTLGIISISLVAVYFVSGTPLWHTTFLAISAIASAFLFIKIEPYRMQRFLVFLNPEIDPQGIGFQLKQSLLAIGSGGIFGKGLGISAQKLILPQAMSDSVFAILGEETGIIGSTLVILLFILFFWKSISIAKRTHDNFSRLIVVGIVVWLSSQTFLNIASSVGFWPLTGIPLPFFSYGGSHLITEVIAIGLLLNISKNG